MSVSARELRSSDTNPDRGSDPLGSLVTPFAGAIFATAEAYRQFRGVLPAAFRKRLTTSLFDEIRGAAGVHRHRASQAAATERHRMGIDRLGAKTWQDQPEFDPDGRVFVVEHSMPIAHLVYACMLQRTQETVADVVVRFLGPVWLLRREHDALAKLGLRARLRVAGPRVGVGSRARRDALYHYAGIVLSPPDAGEAGGDQ